MTEQEYIAMGGEAADFETANQYYMDIDGLWETKQQFAAIYLPTKRNPLAWKIIRALSPKAQEIAGNTRGLFSSYEVITRLIDRELENFSNEEEHLTARLSELQAKHHQLGMVAKLIKAIAHD